MSDAEYLNGILAEIDRIKARGGKALFRPNEKIEASSVTFLANYFVSNFPQYRFETKRCETCKGTYDILIFF